MTAREPEARASFRAGVRRGVPFAAASCLLAASFGLLAREAGFSPLEAIVMSAVVFAGSAQFASVAILASGGGAAAAIVASGLMNSRFLPMGIALAPSLPGSALARFVQGQAVVDSSWAVSLRPDGSFDRWYLFGTTAPQYVLWSVGTVAGAYGGDLVDADALGLDAIFPAFFLSILAPELRSARTVAVALGGAAVAWTLVPVAPAGVPVLAAAAVALVGLRRGTA